MRIQLQLILAACIVDFGLTSGKWHNLEVNKTYDDSQQIAEEYDVSDNLKNLLNSMVKKDAMNYKVYSEILKQGAAKEQQAFDAIRGELRVALNKNANKIRNFYKKSNVHENNIAVKRETTDVEPHIGRFDIRVGRIVGVADHPYDEPFFYELKIDIGQEELRTLICPFTKFFTKEELQNRRGVFIVNAKYYRICGVNSTVYFLYACENGHVDILTPPPTARLGDSVTVPGYVSKPDARVNRKDEKMFHVILKNLKTNEKKEATYKGVPWQVDDKGPVTGSSLTNASIYVS